MTYRNKIESMLKNAQGCRLSANMVAKIVDCPKDVAYQHLVDLEEDGLVECIPKPDPDHPDDLWLVKGDPDPGDSMWIKT